MRVMMTVAGALVTLLVASHTVYADPGNGNGWGQGTGGGRGHNAPAPLLAAGIPAFVALGGGVAANRLWKKLARRS